MAPADGAQFTRKGRIIMSSVDEEQKVGKLKAWLPEKWDWEADVVVMGYGGAGACAAIAAHDTGGPGAHT